MTQATIACAPLINWLRVACAVRIDNQASAVQHHCPTIPLVGSTSIEAHHLGLMRQDLPGRFLQPAANQVDGPAIYTTSSQSRRRLSRIATFEGMPRTKSQDARTHHSRKHWDANQTVGLKHSGATSHRTGCYCRCELAKVWNAVAAAPKSSNGLCSSPIATVPPRNWDSQTRHYSSRRHFPTRLNSSVRSGKASLLPLLRPPLRTLSILIQPTEKPTAL